VCTCPQLALRECPTRTTAASSMQSYAVVRASVLSGTIRTVNHPGVVGVNGRARTCMHALSLRSLLRRHPPSPCRVPNPSTADTILCAAAIRRASVWRLLQTPAAYSRRTHFCRRGEPSSEGGFSQQKSACLCPSQPKRARRPACRAWRAGWMEPGPAAQARVTAPQIPCDSPGRARLPALLLRCRTG